MLLGYARVSPDDQDNAGQSRMLRDTGCEIIFREQPSHDRWVRPELDRLLRRIESNDVLVVCTIDRISRSVRDVFKMMEVLHEKGAFFRSLHEGIDTSCDAGPMFMRMVSAFNAFERLMLKERTKAGLHSGRQDGRVGGRPSKLDSAQKLEVLALLRRETKTAAEVARIFGVHRTTIARIVHGSQEEVLE